MYVNLQSIPGTLDAVTSIKRNLSVITWEPPFSLDITNSDPDIVYCVEFYNITCGSRDSIFSDCNVNESSYTHSSILNPGYIYEIFVTPRSNVEGAENGMTSAISSMLFSIKLISASTIHTYTHICTHKNGRDWDLCRGFCILHNRRYLTLHQECV